MATKIREVYVGVTRRGEPSNEYRQYRTAEQHAGLGGFVVTKEIWTRADGMVWSESVKTTEVSDVYPLG